MLVFLTGGALTDQVLKITDHPRPPDITPCKPLPSVNAWMCSMQLAHHMSTTLLRDDNSSTPKHTAVINTQFVFPHSVSSKVRVFVVRRPPTQEIFMHMSQHRIAPSPLTDLLSRKHRTVFKLFNHQDSVLSSGSAAPVTGSGSLEKQSAFMCSLPGRYCIVYS